MFCEPSFLPLDVAPAADADMNMDADGPYPHSCPADPDVLVFRCLTALSALYLIGTCIADLGLPVVPG